MQQTTGAQEAGVAGTRLKEGEGGWWGLGYSGDSC